MAQLNYRLAQRADAAVVGDIRLAAADDLTSRFSTGHWSSVAALPTLRKHCESGHVYLVASAGTDVATFNLFSRKPGFYRSGWFACPDDPAIYLTHMAVHPDQQGCGVGSQIMVEIERITREGDCKAVRFDAYDADVGAGGFYEKCGYTCVHRGSFNRVPLEYFEKVLA